jgi:large conductance mechanosensitive channel
MKIIDEFKKFAMRGNVIDLAVGIIIGGAFGKIVSSIVADVIMPPIGLLIGGVNFTDLKITIKDPDVAINYGNFLQATFDFIIIAFAVFMLIKLINRVNSKKEEEKPVEKVVSEDVKLLTEIRDLLKNK